MTSKGLGTWPHRIENHQTPFQVIFRRSIRKSCRLLPTNSMRSCSFIKYLNGFLRKGQKGLMLHYSVNYYTLRDRVLVLSLHCTKQRPSVKGINLMEIIFIWGSWRLPDNNKECINTPNTQMVDR